REDEGRSGGYMKLWQIAAVAGLAVLASSRPARATNPCDADPNACKEWSRSLAGGSVEATPGGGDAEVLQAHICDADPARCDAETIARSEKILKKEAEERLRLGWTVEWKVPEAAVNHAGFSFSESKSGAPLDAGLSWRESGSGLLISAAETRILVSGLLAAEIAQRQGGLHDGDATETARLQSLSEGLGAGRSIVELDWPSYEGKPGSGQVPLRFRRVANPAKTLGEMRSPQTE
ncbi:MAG: hypothetical protein ACHQ49_08960, partial [Elusimicrobiota bacterium]